MRILENLANKAAITLAGTLAVLTPGTPAEEKPRLENIIRWETASESSNFGYDVYRGPTKTGPFHRLTDEPIPGAGTTDLPNRYQYIDPAIEPQTVYWYYVESISLSGERRRITPVYPSRSKKAR